MYDTTVSLPEPHRLAHAFLALTDEVAAEPARRSMAKALAAIAAVLVLAVAMPLTWMAPTARTAKVGDQPAATLGSSKALLAAPDDEDADGAG